MNIKKLFKFESEQTEDYMELEHQAEEAPQGGFLIEIEKMESIEDAARLQQKVRDGRIVLVKIKELRTKSMDDLKKAVEKIRKTCIAINGDIAGISNDWVVLTPSTVKVQRNVAESAE